jgi:hypothetical protein
MEAAQSKMRGLSEREKVVTELIDTERTYLDQLSQLIEVHEKPLHQTDMVNQYAHKRIFTNTVALHQVVVDLVKAIDECEAQGTQFTMSGRTYDRMVTVNFGKLYAVNITQSERAAETLSQLLKSNKQQRDFQAECRRGGRRPLEELLLRAVSARVPPAAAVQELAAEAHGRRRRRPRGVRGGAEQAELDQHRDQRL